MALNVTGPIVSIREIAERVAGVVGITPAFEGDERDDALIANVEQLSARLPYSALPLDTLCAWAVAWIQANGRILDKATKFEVRDGKY